MTAQVPGSCSRPPRSTTTSMKSLPASSLSWSMTSAGKAVSGRGDGPVAPKGVDNVKSGSRCLRAGTPEKVMSDAAAAGPAPSMGNKAAAKTAMAAALMPMRTAWWVFKVGPSDVITAGIAVPAETVARCRGPRPRRGEVRLVGTMATSTDRYGFLPRPPRGRGTLRIFTRARPARRRPLLSRPPHGWPGVGRGRRPGDGFAHPAVVHCSASVAARAGMG